MEEQAKLKVSRSQIIGDLPYCALVKRAGGFGLDDQLAVDNHIQPLTCYLFSFVDNRYANFATDIVTTIV